MSRYVHGYSARETQRLQEQSGILEELLHSGTAYPPGSRVLEAGCGVGAQTVVLAQRSPEAEFTSIDVSSESLDEARSQVERRGLSNVRLQRADVVDLPFDEDSFDHIFVCFVLEHLSHPSRALEGLRRVLRRGGSLTLIEGDHGSCFWHPQTRESIEVWQCMIEAQQRLGHDPLIGRRLHSLLREAGFRVEDVSPRSIYGDAGKPAILDGVVNKIIVPMVQTARRKSLETGMIDATAWDRGVAGLERSGVPPDGAFFYTWFKAVALK